MTTYKVWEDSGASEIVHAESLDSALELAKSWASEGDYDERVLVVCFAIEIDEDGDLVGYPASDEVEAGPETEEPACSGDDHDWQTPHHLVGGCDSNPGVWSGGTSMRYKDVCASCGWRRTISTTGWQRNPGDLPKTVSYEKPTLATLAWVAKVAEA